jgi:AcrR family transcriptional regulator
MLHALHNVCVTDELTPAPGESLRDRKARLTRAAIHEAAVRLACEHGLDAATVAQIAEAAGVSPRTFFNYFASKEDAVIGTAVSGPDQQVVRDIVAQSDFSTGVLTEIARVVRELMSRSLGDDETEKLRRTLLLRHPGLVQRKVDANTALAGVLIDELVPVLAPHLAQLDIPPDTPPRDVVRMLVVIAFAPLRHAFGPPSAASAPEPDAQEMHDRFDRSLALFTSVLEGTRP